VSNDNKFIDGLIVKAPNDRAPEYVKAKLSIKRAELIAWLQSQAGEWINADVKVSQQGKWYAAVDDFPF
jgi:lipopolysaccharide export LptBFGC system permease protein LptF